VPPSSGGAKRGKRGKLVGGGRKKRDPGDCTDAMPPESPTPPRGQQKHAAHPRQTGRRGCPPPSEIHVSFPVAGATLKRRSDPGDCTDAMPPASPDPPRGQHKHAAHPRQTGRRGCPPPSEFHVSFQRGTAPTSNGTLAKHVPVLATTTIPPTPGERCRGSPRATASPTPSPLPRPRRRQKDARLSCGR